MFIVESENDSYINEAFGVLEITDWSDDSYNILESSLFFEEDMSRIIKATALAEVMSYNEGTIESFNEGVASTVWNKIKQLWEKLKAFLKKIRDRFMAWIRKTFMSSESFFSKYKTVIKDNISKLERKNPKISVPDFQAANGELNKLDPYFDNEVGPDGAKYKTSSKLGDTATEDNYLDSFNDACEEIDDIVSDFHKELDRKTEENVKEITMADNTKITTAIVGDKPIKTYNDKHKTLEEAVKKTEKALKPMLKSGYVHDTDYKENDSTKGKNEKPSMVTKLIIYNLKIAKKALTAKHNGVIALAKAEVKAMTKVAYEAVKLQNTKEEDIKEESASIDLLNKYLQRI